MKIRLQALPSQFENVPFDDLSRYQFSDGHNQISHKFGEETGRETLYMLQPGIILRILEMNNCSRGTESISLPENQLIFGFKLKGNNLLTGNFAPDFEMKAGSLSVAYSTKQLNFEERSEQNSEYLLVMLMFQPDVLSAPPFEIDNDQLPQCINDVFSGKEFFVKAFSMTTDTIQTLGVLLNSLSTDYLSRPFIQAKTVELMCLALRNIWQQENQQQLLSLPQKDKELIEKAAQLLLEQWQHPPTQEQLAKTLGLGKSKLKQGFKIIHGCSMKEFLINIRLQKAQQLLISNNFNVTQVALETGYEHSSNFVSAFKNKFGITPKTFQKMSLQNQSNSL